MINKETYNRLTQYMQVGNNIVAIQPQRKERIQMYIDRLFELEDKIENGTLVELPCKVGDVVYAFVFEIEPHIEQYSVIAIEIGIETFIRCFEAKRGLCYLRPTSIFLTKAEAEEKLKELQEGKYK